MEQSARRLIRVTPGNLRQSHLYLKEVMDLLPPECFGPPRKRSQARSSLIRIDLAGLEESVHTDVGTTANGKPRRFFRGREWVRRFFEHHGTVSGDHIAFDRISERHFRIAPAAKNLAAAEFFSGIGLVRIALESCGWTVRFANDIDESKARIYRSNWPQDSHLHVGDIHDIDVRDLPACDLFTASFPCNDLSIAGRMDGIHGRESSAFWGLMRLLQELGERRPRWVVLENVVGFLQSDNGRDYESAMMALTDLGYSVDAVILNACHWVPQSRARLFVVAERGAPAGRSKIALETDSRPRNLCRFINTHPNINWGLKPLPPLPRRTKSLRDIIEKLPEDDPLWWNQERVDYFVRQLSEKHHATAMQMVASRRTEYATAFRRVRYGRSMAELRTDGIAGCLRTPRGGSGRQILVAAGRGKLRVRLLSPRECARLQGVPESFRIEAPLNQALFGFGDAVCVPVVEWLLRNVVCGDTEASHSVSRQRSTVGAQSLQLALT